MHTIPSTYRPLGGLLLTCALLLSACSGAPAVDKPGGPAAPAEGASPSTAETQMLQAVNAARATARKCQGKDFAAAPALAWNGLLGKAARAHAQDMAARNYFDHVSPDGGTMTTRAEAAGYTGWKKLGENIAAGFKDSQIPEAMNAWLESKTGHCEALMNPGFREVGFGYAPATGGQYSAYWVQDFGTR